MSESGAVRSRGGCLTCRKRKRKCDETRPTCRTCRARGVSCGGYELQLKWANSVASRGHLSGAKVPLKAVADKPERPVISVEASPTIGPASARYNGAASHGLRAAEAVMSTTTENAALIKDSVILRPTKEGLFKKFLTSGINSFYATQHNDIVKEWIEFLSLDSEALVSVCIALQVSEDEGKTSKFHRSLDCAVRLFKHELNNFQGQMKYGLMCAGIFLCTISAMSGLKWTPHISCMADLYQLHDDLSSFACEVVAAHIHCLEVLGVMDIPALAIGRTNPSLGLWWRLRRAQEARLHMLPGGTEPVTGLPRSLLDIFARIQDPAVEFDLWMWHDEIGDLLQAQLWDAFRYAGILLSRRCRRLGDFETEGSLDTVPNAKLPRSEYLLWRLISALEVLNLGYDQSKYQHLLFFNATTFPYFVARLQVQLLAAHPEWKDVLDLITARLTQDRSDDSAGLLLEILTEVENSKDEYFDVDKAAKAKGVEIMLF